MTIFSDDFMRKPDWGDTSQDAKIRPDEMRGKMTEAFEKWWREQRSNAPEQIMPHSIVYWLTAFVREVERLGAKGSSGLSPAAHERAFVKAFHQLVRDFGLEEK